ncbi:MAG TPA: sigma-54 dependent transcriptional regulator, partial [Verrucomicrobiota bacterium]|nr:sigma-54 dependent transcriptional regulator [Verrucomicrobiota bacterium]
MPILVVDDEKNMRSSLATVLGDEGYSVELVESAEQGLAMLERESFFMVITDARLGGMSGYEFLARVRQQWPDLPVLMITAYATPKLAVEAIKAGAIDYLSKPFAPEELLHAVNRCAERHRLLQENAQLRARAGEASRLEDIVGESPQMRQLRQLIQTVAPTDARVLILGESGTGKELVAGALHSLSHRRQAPYVRINCAAIPETLLESELFGHEKGAFTGALRQKPGRVEEANGGTIFLDEIADMSRPLQAKLLRFLEDGSFTRIGGTQELRVNVRLIAATNRDIVQAIRDGQFREDLFHRLNVVQMRLPPLRERGDDVLLLAEHFLKHFNATLNKHVKGISKGARQKLMAHHWPGNVRELRNVIERALILELDDEIQAVSLPDFKLEAQLHKTREPQPRGDESLDELLANF